MLHRPPVKRAAAVCRGNMLLMMMAVLEDIFPLDLCTPSTCHSAVGFTATEAPDLDWNLVLSCLLTFPVMCRCMHDSIQ